MGRINKKSVSISPEDQLEYYSRWQPAILHLATSCPGLRTDQALAERFGLELNEVKATMKFLARLGLVTLRAGGYHFSGESIHLGKGSALHRVFQKTRRELIARALEKPRAESLHVSSAFATSEKHYQEIRNALLGLIQKVHLDLAHTDSEELRILATDFSRVV